MILEKYAVADLGERGHWLLPLGLKKLCKAYLITKYFMHTKLCGTQWNDKYSSRSPPRLLAIPKCNNPPIND